MPEEPKTPEEPGIPEEPNNPIIPNTPESPAETPNETVTPEAPSDNDKNVTTENPITAAAKSTQMKETGMPIIAILLLIVSVAGTIIRKR